MTAFTSAITAAQNVLVVHGLPRRKSKRSRSAQATPKASASPKAVPNERGKSFQQADLRATKVQKAGAAGMKAFDTKLSDAGINSPKQFFSIADEAMTHMITDGTTRITVSSWLGTILEIEGPKHPHVKTTTDLFIGAALRFANDAVSNKRAVFVDGIGRIRTLPKRLRRTDVREVHDLRINGQKYCDRAFVHTDADGNVFIILTQEYKTAGNKRSDVDAQQFERNVRLVDESRAVGTGKNVRSDGTQLTYFEAGKKKVQEVDIAQVLIHTENTDSQIGIKASSNTFEGVRFPQRGNDKYKAVYYYLRIDWPSREIRAVLQMIWDQL